MGKKGHKDNADKSQKQISEKLDQQDNSVLVKQQTKQQALEILSDKTDNKKKAAKALDANMQAIKKTDK